MEAQNPPRQWMIGRKFIAGSVLVHLLVLFGLPGPPQARPAATVLMAELRAPALTPAVPQTQEPTRLRPPPKLAAKPPRPAAMETPPTVLAASSPTNPPTNPPIVTSAAVAVSEVAAVATSVAEIPAIPAVASTADATLPEVRERRGKPSTLWLAGYTRTISGQVARLKHYPPIARLRGWEGTTVVAIQLAADGTVLHTRIEQSSGHPVLDSQALAMVRQAEPLPPYPQGHNGDPLTVRLPIVFALAAPG